MLKNNQSAIKALATVGKAAATAGSVVGGAVKQVYGIVKKSHDEAMEKGKRKKLKTKTERDGSCRCLN